MKRRWKWPCIFIMLAGISLLKAMFESDFDPDWHREIIDQGGVAALLCLLMSMLSPWFGRKGREWGLAAFLIGTLHGLAQMGWVQDWHFADVNEDSLLQWGAAAWLILLALALTSWPAFNKIMGFEMFRELHRLVYLAALLLVGHLMFSGGDPVWVLILSGALLGTVALRLVRRS